MITPHLRSYSLLWNACSRCAQGVQVGWICPPLPPCRRCRVIPVNADNAQDTLRAVRTARGSPWDLEPVSPPGGEGRSVVRLCDHSRWLSARGTCSFSFSRCKKCRFSAACFTTHETLVGWGGAEDESSRRRPGENIYCNLHSENTPEMFKCGFNSGENYRAKPTKYLIYFSMLNAVIPVVNASS